MTGFRNNGSGKVTGDGRREKEEAITCQDKNGY